ncbi:MAG: ABC transporter permease subunit [Clostridia bacterium]|nr:ABC transporter permease subunit [Clostridia bacterium]
MTAVFKKELRAYFISPMGYAFLFVFSLLSAALLTVEIIYASQYNMRQFFSNFFTNTIMVLMFLIPILTMKLFSEERKTKTDQILFTSPVSTTGVVMGKFFAAFVIYAIAVAITFIYVIIINTYSPVDFLMIFGNYFGLLLLGGTFIAIGMFISATTENQVIAAVVSFAVMIAMFLVSYLNDFVSGIFATLVSFISVVDRYMYFNEGLLNFSSILFFISVAALFIYLTVRLIEKRRWS